MLSFAGRLYRHFTSLAHVHRMPTTSRVASIMTGCAIMSEVSPPTNPASMNGMLWTALNPRGHPHQTISLTSKEPPYLSSSCILMFHRHQNGNSCTSKTHKFTPILFIIIVGNGFVLSFHHKLFHYWNNFYFYTTFVPCCLSLNIWCYFEHSSFPAFQRGNATPYTQ